MATPSIMEVMQAMFNNLNNTITNSNDSLRAEINNNNDSLRAEINNNQALNTAARMEMFELIDQRSRKSTRAPTRATSRAVSPKTLVAQVSAKLESGVQETPVQETPRINSFGPDLSLTQVFRDKEAADSFAEENAMRRQRAPKISNRDNTHAYRDSYNATHRPNDPLKTESFTRTTPECKARLEGPLTLAKCLEFQKDILDFQNKYNVEVRHTSYFSDELKAEMKKSMLGIRKVKFFGYECEKGKFRIDERRRTDIQAIPAPISRKGMQSFLGTVVICSGFIPDNSVRAFPSYNMTTASYDWSTAWSDKELLALEDIKQAVIQSCALHYPK